MSRALTALALVAALAGCRAPAPPPVPPPLAGVDFPAARVPEHHRLRQREVKAIYVLFAEHADIEPSGKQRSVFDGAIIIDRDGGAYYTDDLGGRGAACVADTIDPTEIGFFTADGEVDGRGRFTPHGDHVRAAWEGFTVWAFPEVAPEARAKAVYRPAFQGDRALHYDGQPGRAGASGQAGKSGSGGRDGRRGDSGRRGRDGSGGTDGQPGTPGSDAGDGEPGTPGQEALDLTVDVERLPSPFYERGLVSVRVRSTLWDDGTVVIEPGQGLSITAHGGEGGRGGHGGSGGTGGGGGHGGDGGKGAKGEDATAPGARGERGGDGGDGGHGGDGADGGNGGNGAPGGPGGNGGRIAVTYHDLGDLLEDVRRGIRFSNRGGAGGSPGNGGAAGPGGSAGKGGRGGEPGAGGRGGPALTDEEVDPETGEVEIKIVIPAGKKGRPGQDGPDGREGQPGRDGRPGEPAQAEPVAGAGGQITVNATPAH